MSIYMYTYVLWPLIVGHFFLAFRTAALAGGCGGLRRQLREVHSSLRRGAARRWAAHEMLGSSSVRTWQLA